MSSPPNPERDPHPATMNTASARAPSLLAPITLNSAPVPKPKKSRPLSMANGSSNAINPLPSFNNTSNRNSVAQGPANRMSKRASRIVLGDMEPPPIIPAAAEENGYVRRDGENGSGRRSRPNSGVGSEWGLDEDGGGGSDGYDTPRGSAGGTRPGSVGSQSTTNWGVEDSPASASARKVEKKRSGMFGRKKDKEKGKEKEGGKKAKGKKKAREEGYDSSDGGDEMDYDRSGVQTPASRRSVQYVPTPVTPSGLGGFGLRNGNFPDEGELETPLNPKKSFFRHFAPKRGNHGRTLSGWTVDSAEDQTDNGVGYQSGMPGHIDEGAESEDLRGENLRRVRSHSPMRNLQRESISMPGTPRATNRGFRASIIRRATATDGEESDHPGTPGRRAFNRRSSIRNRMSRRGSREDGERPAYTAALSGYTKDTAAKWKAKIKTFGGRGKRDKVDQQKSAELVAELSAGTPAALILASMFQRDENGKRRIPILLEQLKVRISDSKHSQKGARSQVVFRIDLEYGSGLTRMEWTIWREFRDFVSLHTRYRYSSLGEHTHKLPKFPRETIPYFKGVRGLGSDVEEAIRDDSAPEGIPGEIPPPRRVPTDPTSPAQQKKRPRFLRRVSSSAADMRDSAIHAGVASALAATATAAGGAAVQNVIKGHQNYAVRQRQQLEEYLRRLIRVMIFRPESNRLCRFLELSALGVRLAGEGSYHGKEGYLIMRSTTGGSFGRPWAPHNIAKRHSPKWFLVRHSYIVCVDSPEEMNIYDVFLVDSKFSVGRHKFQLSGGKAKISEEDPTSAAARDASKNSAKPQHHNIVIRNHERSIKLLAKNERQMGQFLRSIEHMAANTMWARPQRFGSFAPVRQNVYAQWLVDGRDYFWTVSRAISMAKDVIYIHDWWLSPELYLRRPAAVSQKWRLDRLLQKKAREGVKIFVIVYRNVDVAIPIDSSYTKYSLLDLHANIYVQRSPNQIRQNTFFWAHHEKILIVDHMIAFVGGIDLCFGRWDTPQHSVVDHKPSGFEEGCGKEDPDNFQLWPGKDYSNPRVQDFYALDKPYEDMYDRENVPRMPWHDIHMQVVGQPARDLTRHFIQRWNYLLRQRTPSRPTPLLLPQPDFREGELESLGVAGTCEVQILRSASSWSLGTPDHTEDSIHKAYIKSIELSEHIVYIENQFFVTSTEFDGTVIENKIGDALVERITRAFKNDEDWRAIIIIPLMPGFQNPIDAPDGTSVRLIMHCQYRSISQGENSIFHRLKMQGIDPDEYIQFFSLRNWGKIGADNKLVTEQLYIHAKCMIVDDRIVIIGSANINERSMLGSRDSEVAAIVRDTDGFWSTMAGRPFEVTRFAHSLRVRLMREHLGLDVDAIMMEEQMEAAEMAAAAMEAEGGGSEGDPWEEQMRQWHQESAADIVSGGQREVQTPRTPAFEELRAKVDNEALQRIEKLRSFNHDVDWEQENNPNLKARKKGTSDPRVSGNKDHRDDVRGFGKDHMVQLESERASMSADRVALSSPTSNRFTRTGRRLLSDASQHFPGHHHNRRSHDGQRPSSSRTRSESFSSPLDHIFTRRSTPHTADSSSLYVTPDPYSDPPLPPYPTKRQLTSELGLPQLSQLPPLPATSDTDIGGPPDPKTAAAFSHPALPPGFAQPAVLKDMFADPLDDAFYTDVWCKIASNNTEIYRQVFRCQPDNEVKTWAAYKEVGEYAERLEEAQRKRAKEAKAQNSQTDLNRPTSTAGGGDEKVAEKTDKRAFSSSTTIASTIAFDEKELTSYPTNPTPGIRLSAAPTDPNAGNYIAYNPNHRPVSHGTISSNYSENRPKSSGPLNRLNTSASTASRHSNHSLQPGGTAGGAVGGGGPGPVLGAAMQAGAAVSNAVHYADIPHEPAPHVHGMSDEDLHAHVEDQGQGSGSQSKKITPKERKGSTKRRRRAATAGSRKDAGLLGGQGEMDLRAAEELLEMVQGHLVWWPHDWLSKEQETGNWLYNIDMLAPIEIYD